MEAVCHRVELVLAVSTAAQKLAQRAPHSRAFRSPEFHVGTAGNSVVCLEKHSLQKHI